MHINQAYNWTFKILEISTNLGIEDYQPDLQAKGPVNMGLLGRVGA